MPTIYDHTNMNEAAPSDEHLLDAQQQGCAEDPQEELGLDMFPGRVLCCTEVDDHVVLPMRLLGELESIWGHYERVGLQVTPHVHMQAQGARDAHRVLYADYPEYDCSVFYFGASTHAVRQDGWWLSAAHRYLSKSTAMRMCAKLGVRTPKTYCFERHKVCSMQMPSVGFVKTSRGVGGHGNIAYTNIGELREALARVVGIAYQVQAKVDAEGFYSIAYREEDGAAIPWVLTKQTVEDSAWVGSECPTAWSLQEVHDEVGKVAQYMVDDGMRGMFNIDLAYGVDGLWYVIEVNPRYTASMYPAIAAKRLGIEQWHYEVYPTVYRTLRDIELGSLEFDAATRTGAVVVDWGSVLGGQVGVLLAHTSSRELDGQQVALRAVLGSDV